MGNEETNLEKESNGFEDECMDEPCNQNARPQAPQQSGQKSQGEQQQLKSTDIEEIKIKVPIKGYLVGDKVIVREDFQRAQEFFSRSSFGEVHGVKEKQLELALDEAFYLMERGKLEVFLEEEQKQKGKKAKAAFREVKLKPEQFLMLASKAEKNFWTKYQVYRDIRTRGYITKTALKFGADYRLYRRGVKPGEDHAKWVLFCASESDTETWNNFSAKNRVAHSTRKKLLLGIVDKEGEVTYYEVRWKKP